MGSRRARGIQLGVSGALALLALTLPLPAGAATVPVRHGLGNVLVNCQHTRSAPADPILLPRRPGAAHMHDFFGNVSTTAFSTRRKLLSRPSECTRDEDRSAYWAPALGYPPTTAGGSWTWLEPRGMQIYYRANDREPSSIEPFPRGVRVVAGDMHAMGPQDPRRVGWFCANDALGAPPWLTLKPEPLSCGPFQFLFARVLFPDCSDGRADSPDHMSHMAYSRGGEQGPGWRQCPASHPIPVPQVRISIGYDSDAGIGTQLSSGGRFSLHADFFEAWQGDSLEGLIERCIAKDLSCGT